MRLFTGKGDDGSTDLLGARVAKDDARIDLLGTLDEATSAIGLARAQAQSERTPPLLVTVQRDLYEIMAELAYTDDLRPGSRQFDGARVIWLEDQTDGLTTEVSLPPEFVLPGDSVSGAALDVARTVVRRSERETVALHHHQQLRNHEILRYLNRLSSLLFIAARFEDRASGVKSTPAKVRDGATDG